MVLPCEDLTVQCDAPFAVVFFCGLFVFSAQALFSTSPGLGRDHLEQVCLESFGEDQ